jgi:sugar lactone lactonase YvrE
MKYARTALTAFITLCAGCSGTASTTETRPSALPNSISVTGIALNPEGIEYRRDDGTFLLSSLNAGPIINVQLDGTYAPFTSGEAFPLSSAGLQIDAARNRLLVAGFNGTALFDNDPETKGTSHLRVYDLQTGVIEQDINLSALLPDAAAYFANDIAVDTDGNAYVSDWYAGVIYRVDVGGTPSVFWTNQSVVPGGPNGLDYHPDGYLLVSVINDGTYSKHALVKVPVADPSAAVDVVISDPAFSGFDGMVITATGQVVGVTNDGVAAGGNVLLELSGSEDWTSATVSRSLSITPSTTVAVTPDNKYFVINQDFTDAAATDWTIEQIVLPSDANP